MPDAMTLLPIRPRLLSGLLFLMGGLVAPHMLNLDHAIIGFFYCCALWRLWGMRRPTVLPGRWILVLLTVGGMVLVLETTGVSDGRRTGTALLVVMLGLKLLEIRSRRDIHIAVFLGYFLVLTQLLYDQSLGVAVYLFAGVVALTVILVGLNRVRVALRTQWRSTIRMIAAAVPMTIVVFLLFPRLDSPLWAVTGSGSVTGISGEIKVGDIGKLSQSTETAFRVRFFGREPTPSERYWRGPVLWNTDGKEWTVANSYVRSEDASPLASSPDDLRYEITLEPTGEYWLFGLDLVTSNPEGTRLNRNYTLVSDHRVNQRFSYQATSNPKLAIDELSRREKELGLQLPTKVSARVRALAEQWRSESANDSPMQIVERALRFFREEPFVYTLEPGELSGDPTDQFLFETRRGFCEHYATSFTLLMRLAGIPARVVVGYQGGERNPHADHWIVRQSDAHAWSEVWLPNLGWFRVDPTSAVAPQRIEQAINPLLSQESGHVVFESADFGFLRGALRNANWLIDAVDLRWHRWIVGFTAERQGNLLENLGLDELRGFALAIALLIGCALAGIFVYLMTRIPRGRKANDPMTRLWSELVLKLRRSGVPVADWYGPDTLCATARVYLPDQADELAAINRLFVQLRYGRNSETAQVAALRRRVHNLRLKPRRQFTPSAVGAVRPTLADQ